MRKINNKLYADYESNHIMMVFPWMYQKYYYFNDLMAIYKTLSEIFHANKVKQTFIFPHKETYDDELLNYFKASMNIIKHDCNDIWVRDFYPKLYTYQENKKMINYSYNGYGEKYEFAKDNKLKKIFNKHLIGLDLTDLVLEGGNLEFSSKGLLLSNIHSIIKNNINLSHDEIKKRINELKDEIDIREIFMIDISPMKGDDTNGHIDNLIRFVDDETLLYFASEDKSYHNYELACKLKKQINNICAKSKIIKNIVPIFHNSSDMLIKNKKICPYSKLNFIITKNCYIFPSINLNHHSLREQLSKLKLDKKFYVLNSEASLIENGGLHCLTANI